MKTPLLIAVFICLLAQPSFAEKANFGSLIVKKLDRVYDGDTFYALFDGKESRFIGGCPDGSTDCVPMPVRIYGVDTPEIRDKSAEQRQLAKIAREFVLLELSRARVIELRNIQRGKYCRIVAEVYVDGQSLSKLILDKGLGKPYYGGRRY